MHKPKVQGPVHGFPFIRREQPRPAYGAGSSCARALVQARAGAQQRTRPKRQDAQETRNDSRGIEVLSSRAWKGWICMRRGIHTPQPCHTYCNAPRRPIATRHDRNHPQSTGSQWVCNSRNTNTDSHHLNNDLNHHLTQADAVDVEPHERRRVTPYLTRPGRTRPGRYTISDASGPLHHI